MPIASDVQLLEVDAVVQLFILDGTDKGGDVYRFHREQAKTGANLTGDLAWDGITYNARPIRVEGLDMKTDGTKARPKLRIANVEALVSGLMIDFDDLIGWKLTRKRTLAKYLDDGASPDPTQRFADDIYYIVQPESEDPRGEVVFALGDPSDLPGIFIPLRKFSATYCGTEYRGEVCQYAGDPLAELDGTTITGPFVDRGTWSKIVSNYVAKDVVTVVGPGGVPHVFCARGAVPTGTHPSNSTHWAADRCTKKIARCKLTHGADNELPFDAFLALARIPQ
jgi:lambda family phage minor tail protein L